MKISLFLLFFVDVTFVKGQQRIEELQHILLTLSFPSFYNNYNKSCCKLYPGGCYKLMDSAGYTCDFLRGRVTKFETNGWVEFKVINVQVVDAGYYRCGIEGAHTPIYTDYYIEVFASNHEKQAESLPTTIKAPISSPGPTEPVLSQDPSDDTRAPWSFAVPLALIISVTGMILISVLITIVCRRVKTKFRQSDTCGGTLSESLTHEVPEVNAVVYTTVDFRLLQPPEDVYANLKMQRSPPGTQDADHNEIVEYSTIALQL